MLADAAPPSANSVWYVILALASLAGNVAMVFQARAMARNQKVEVSPQPLIVAMEKEFTPRRDFDAHVAANVEEHDKIFSKIGGVERGARHTLDAQVEVIRRDTVQIGNQVAALQAETKMQSAQLTQLTRTMNDLPSRIVADIVNSKKL